MLQPLPAACPPLQRGAAPAVPGSHPRLSLEPTSSCHTYLAPTPLTSLACRRPAPRPSVHPPPCRPPAAARTLAALPATLAAPSAAACGRARRTVSLTLPMPLLILSAATRPSPPPPFLSRSPAARGGAPLCSLPATVAVHVAAVTDPLSKRSPPRAQPSLAALMSLASAGLSPKFYPPPSQKILSPSTLPKAAGCRAPPHRAAHRPAGLPLVCLPFRPSASSLPCCAHTAVFCEITRTKGMGVQGDGWLKQGRDGRVRWVTMCVAWWGY